MSTTTTTTTMAAAQRLSSPAVATSNKYSDDLKEIRVMRTSDASVVKFHLDYSQATLQDLRDEICNSTKIDSSQQRLFFLGRELTNSNKTLQKLGIGRYGNYIVHMHVRSKQQQQKQAIPFVASTTTTTTTTTTAARTSALAAAFSAPSPTLADIFSTPNTTSNATVGSYLLQATRADLLTATPSGADFLAGSRARSIAASSLSGFLPYRNSGNNVPTRPNHNNNNRNDEDVIEILDDDDDDDVIVLPNSKRQRVL